MDMNFYYHFDNFIRASSITALPSWDWIAPGGLCGPLTRVAFYTFMGNGSHNQKYLTATPLQALLGIPHRFFATCVSRESGNTLSSNLKEA